MSVVRKEPLNANQKKIKLMLQGTGAVFLIVGVISLFQPIFTEFFTFPEDISLYVSIAFIWVGVVDITIAPYIIKNIK